MLASMIIGVISDTHGRVDNIRTALAHFRERNVELIIHCGDIDTADAVAAFIGWPTHFVFGNCDWDREAIRSAIARIGGTLHEPYGHLESTEDDRLDSRRPSAGLSRLERRRLLRLSLLRPHARCRAAPHRPNCW